MKIRPLPPFSRSRSAVERSKGGRASVAFFFPRQLSFCLLFSPFLSLPPSKPLSPPRRPSATRQRCTPPRPSTAPPQPNPPRQPARGPSGSRCRRRRRASETRWKRARRWLPGRRRGARGRGGSSGRAVFVCSFGWLVGERGERGGERDKREDERATDGVARLVSPRLALLPHPSTWWHLSPLLARVRSLSTSALSLSLTPPRAHLIVVVAALSVVRRVRRVSRARDDGHRRGRQRRRNAAAHRILHVARVVVVLPLLRGCHVQRRLRSSSSAMLVRLAPRLKKRVPVVVVEGRGRGRLVSRRRCSRGLHLCFFGIMHCGFLELAPLPLPQNSERKERDGLESSSLSLSLSRFFLLAFFFLHFPTSITVAMTALASTSGEESLGEDRRACLAALSSSLLHRHRRRRRRSSSSSFFLLPTLLLVLFCITCPLLVSARSAGAPCELWPGEKLPPVYARCDER